jgi:predicted ATPase
MAELVNSVRIDFSSLRLYGREKEKKRLDVILKRTANGDLKGIQVVEIKGLAGCGKSALAETLKTKVVELSGCYVSGKYDEAQSLSQSYAVRRAIDDLFNELLKDDAIRREMKASLMRDLSYDDIAMLSAVLPDLPDFLEVDLNSEANASHDESSCRPEWMFERIKITVCRFLESVCDPTRPIIIVIEDIQWSDPAGLELLQSIASTKDIEGLILIIQYRDNEVLAVEDHPATRMLAEIRKQISPTSFHTITVGDLKFAHIAQLLADLSYRRPEELFSLAGILRSRTHGNPFFLLHQRSQISTGVIILEDFYSTSGKPNIYRCHNSGRFLQ